MTKIPECGSMKASIFLNRELDNSSTFVFEGIIKIYETQYLGDSGGNVFNFLYNLSVGFERIQKIILFLLEIKEKNNFKISFDEKYQTHNHITLHQFMNEKIDISLNENQTGLLTILADFYNDNRYGRFNFNNDFSSEIKKFIKYISKSMGKSPKKAGEEYNNTIEIKNFLSKQIIKLYKMYYEIIEKLSYELHIGVCDSNSESRTLDLIYGSYYNDDLNFYQKRILLLEEFILILIKLNPKEEYLDRFDCVESLNFKDYLENYGIDDLITEVLYTKDCSNLNELVNISYNEQNIDVKKRIIDFSIIFKDYPWNT